MAREEKRRIPIEPIAHSINPSRADRTSFAGPKIPSDNRTVLALGIKKVRVVRIDAADETVATVDIDPIFVQRPSGSADCWTGPGSIVLQSTGDPIRLLGADRHVIKLTDRSGIDMIPGRPTIVRRVDTAIASENHVPTIARVDPKIVAIGMDPSTKILSKGRPGISGLMLCDPQHIEILLVARIDLHDAKIHRASVQGIDTLPACPAIGGLVNATVLVPLGALLVLNIGGLTEIGVSVRSSGRASRKPIGQDDFDFERLVGTFDLHLEFVVRLMGADFAHEPFVVGDVFAIELKDHIAGLQTRFFGRSGLGDRGQIGTSTRGIFPLNFHKDVALSRRLHSAPPASTSNASFQHDAEFDFFLSALDLELDFVPLGFLLDLFVQRLQSTGGLSINLGDHITDFDSSFCRRTADRDTLNKDLFLLVLAGHTQRNRRRLGCGARSSS